MSLSDSESDSDDMSTDYVNDWVRPGSRPTGQLYERPVVQDTPVQKLVSLTLNNSGKSMRQNKIGNKSLS